MLLDGQVGEGSRVTVDVADGQLAFLRGGGQPAPAG
jgi:ATP-dependent Clp protease ATP-binding subunit ClpC